VTGPPSTPTWAARLVSMTELAELSAAESGFVGFFTAATISCHVALVSHSYGSDVEKGEAYNLNRPGPWLDNLLATSRRRRRRG